MFTGLISHIGSISHKTDIKDGIKIAVSLPLAHQTLRIGDSVALNGICSTVVEMEREKDHVVWSVCYMEETERCTTVNFWEIGTPLNIEFSLTPTSPIGGHIVTGHIDTTGTVTDIQKSGASAYIDISYPEKWAHLVLPKGSISINGISLTLAEASLGKFTCYLIQHTIENTTLNAVNIGDVVNLEFDYLAKYLYHFKHFEEDTSVTDTTDTQQFLLHLKNIGFMT